ncbi:GroES-like protein [Rhizodiscina lignyota]|uniref:GroES-like protein n=1 Tax=Rhizodiscina lignyota TaxID=1504668 RepID=A0A9P4M5K3_9PEZI|nr:GroES-like protein [Rhizodiscina lignyota]
MRLPADVTLQHGSKRKFEGEDQAPEEDTETPAVRPSRPHVKNHRRKRPRVLPSSQKQLQLHHVGGDYEIETVPLPALHHPEELLIEVKSIGLNPIDWKAAAYGYGIPSFPCVYGREFVGKIVAKKETEADDLKVGDTVLAISTDYRDYRKAAFQEFAISSAFNVLRVPETISTETISGMGVAFVTATLSLGVCLGQKFFMKKSGKELDLCLLAQTQQEHEVPEDVRDVVFNGIPTAERAQIGDWLLIMGASAISGQIAVQLAKMCGMRVVAVVDTKRHKERLENLGADLVVDRHNLEESAEIIRKETKGEVRLGLDTIGRETAIWCESLLLQNAPKKETPKDGQRSHLVCLASGPKQPHPQVRSHQLPIKLFHTNPEIGRTLSSWMYELLDSKAIKLIEVDVVEGGLKAVNQSLGRLRRHEVSGKRIVVNMGEGRSRTKRLRRS